MKINVQGFLFNSMGRRAFDGLVTGDDGKPMGAEESLHTMIMEYAKAANGGESKLVTVPPQFIAPKQPNSPFEGENWLCKGGMIYSLNGGVNRSCICVALWNGSTEESEREPAAKALLAMLQAASLGKFKNPCYIAVDPKQPPGTAYEAVVDHPECRGLVIEAVETWIRQGADIYRVDGETAQRMVDKGLQS